MLFQTAIKFARAAKGLTQAALSERSGIDIPNLSFFENGRRTPRFDTATKLLKKTGYSLALVPSVRAGVVEIAETIKGFLAEGQQENAFRVFIQLSDNLVAEPGVNKYALVLTKPNSVGDRAWDAAIAGLVEERLSKEKLVPPKWVDEYLVPKGTPMSVVTGSKYGYGITADDSSPSFTKRGVLVDINDLASV